MKNTPPPDETRVDPLLELITKANAVHRAMKREGDVDGCDYAYFEGLLAMIKACGDGVISENYLQGVRDALELIGIWGGGSYYHGFLRVDEEGYKTFDASYVSPFEVAREEFLEKHGTK